MFNFRRHDPSDTILILGPVMLLRSGDDVLTVDPRSKAIAKIPIDIFLFLLDMEGRKWSSNEQELDQYESKVLSEAISIGLFEIGSPELRAYDANKIRGNLLAAKEMGEAVILNPPALPTVNINERCGFRCLHCYNATGSNNTAEMSEKLITDKILVPLSRMGCVNVMWCGGDPALTPKKTISCTQKASSLGMSVATQVAEYSKEFIAGFTDTGGKAIQVSLYASPKNRHIDDSFRKRQGSWDIAVANIKEAKKKGLLVFVNMVLFPQNAGELVNTATYCYELGVDTFRTTFSVITGHALLNTNRLVFSEQQVNTLLENVRLLKDEFEYKMELITDISEKGKLSGVKYSFCSAGMTYMHAAGNMVYPCNFMMNKEHCMGLLTEASADEIWRNSNVAAPFRVVEPIHEECIGCKKRETTELVCTDCKAVMWNRYGSYLNPNFAACSRC